MSIAGIAIFFTCRMLEGLFIIQTVNADGPVAFFVGAIGILSKFAGVLAAATIYPLLRHQGRLARMADVAKVSEKPAVTVPAINDAVRDSLYRLSFGGFGIWLYFHLYFAIKWYLYRPSYMPSHFSMFTLSSNLGGLEYYSLLPAFVYAAWLVWDTRLQGRRERAILRAWLAPLDEH